MIDFLIKKNINIYVHNLDKFDFRFLVKYLVVNDKLTIKIIPSGSSDGITGFIIYYFVKGAQPR
jgi:hypothetical protein